MPAVSIVVIGDALIDELRTPDSSAEFVGGAALNVAVGLSVLGVETTLVAMVGDDADGGRIRAFLAEHGVQLVATTGAHGSARATSDRRAGEPRYEFNAAAQARAIEFDDRARRALDAADLVAISSFPFDDQAQSDALRGAIDDPGRRLILDPNPRAGMLHDGALFARNFEAVAASALLTKVSDEDATLLGYPSLDALATELLDRGAAHVLTTAGAAGAAITCSDRAQVSVPILQLESPIVDTMGAGDATLATIAAAIASEGVPTEPDAWRIMLADAMAVAAATCRANGALIQLPQGWTGHSA